MRRAIRFMSFTLAPLLVISGVVLVVSAPAGASTVFSGDASPSTLPLMNTLTTLFDNATTGENPYGDSTTPGSSGSETVTPILSSNLQYATVAAPPPASQGTSAQNYVAIAIGGVSWVHFRKIGAMHTPSYAVHNLTVVQLAEIWKGTLSCTIGLNTYVMNWKCLGGHNAGIDCYTAAAGTANEILWQQTLGLSGTPACLNMESVGTASQHTGVTSNSVAPIVSVGDQTNAIYFFSVGPYEGQCPGNVCPGSGGDKTQLGKVNGVAPDQADIQGISGHPGPFPLSSYVWNAYNNSTSGNPDVQAGLNFASEYGFLCNPHTNTVIDPSTSVSYRADIENDIEAAGYWPLDTNPTSPFAEGTVANPAVITDPGYQGVDPGYGSPNPTGYCLVETG